MVPAKSDTTPVRSHGRPQEVVSSGVMTERQSSEVEKVLLFISDAQSRARRASELVERDGADAHIVEALREAQAELGDLHRRLMQGTYYAVPERAQQLSV
jgi:hypothetical protein